MQPTTADSALWEVIEPEIMETDKYLSSANAPDIEEDARLCIASGARRMVLNCANLTYLTSAGLRAFMTMARMMQEVGGKFTVQGLNGQPKEIFYACGMSAFVPVMDAVSNSSTLWVA